LTSLAIRISRQRWYGFSTVAAAGFIDFQTTWRAEVYADAPQASNAEDYGTLGINFDARKPLDVATG
jgi:hypothetical protein